MNEKTCKDCLHYKVCQYHIDEETTMTTYECDNFADSSEWVHWPCKVGDTVYCDGKYFAEHCAGEIMSFPVDIVSTKVCSTFRGEIDMVFNFKDFGKIVFLTREEAEKALAERRKEDGNA